MLRRSQSRTLIASAVLLACLALTGQSRAQSCRTAPNTTLASSSKSIFTKSLIARAQRILIAHSARGQQSLLHLPAATLTAAFIVPTTPHVTPIPSVDAPGLWANQPWQRTSRAFAS